MYLVQHADHYWLLLLENGRLDGNAQHRISAHFDDVKLISFA